MQSFDATLNFGVFPGSSDAYVDTTNTLTAGCPLDAYVHVSVSPTASADHTSDEQRVETLSLSGIVTAVGTIRIYGSNTNAVVARSGPTKGYAPRLVGTFKVRCEWQSYASSARRTYLGNAVYRQ